MNKYVHILRAHFSTHHAQQKYELLIIILKNLKRNEIHYMG
jgi:hypothetical protein